MSNFKLKQLLKKKGILSTLFIVCSLFGSFNAFSWGEDCCVARFMPKNKHFNENRVKIVFKFFQYGEFFGVSNAYLDKLDVFYSTDEGKLYKLLLTAGTKDQSYETKACIDFKNKRPGTKIYLIVPDRNQERYVSKYWQDETRTSLIVNNHSMYKYQTWITLDWHIGDGIDSVTHVRIKATWHPSYGSPNEHHDLLFPHLGSRPRLNIKSKDFFKSTHIQEIKTKAINNSLKACKKANAIVINGAFSEKIQVYKTTGKLVKSFVANNDLVNIELPGKQVYIVHIGQISYKIAL